MIYTYEISLNGSDYLAIYPTNFPKITTAKLEDEFIWRDEVDSFKINKELNDTIYDILETWFDDSTKFNLTNRIRVKKSGTVKWTFVWGIKQGEINYENKYYELTPEIEDQYTDIFYYKNRNVTRAGSEGFHYNNEEDEAAQTIDKIYGAEMSLFEDYVKTGLSSLVGVLNVLSANTYAAQSAFLWNGDYPDGGSPPANTNYVSSDYNYLNTWAIGEDKDTMVNSIDTTLKMPKAFQCNWFCASDYVIHLEHVSWFKDKIADSQLDISGLDYYDDARQFRYSTPEIFNSEDFTFPTDNNNGDYDNVQILYDPALVAYSNEKIDVSTEYDAFISSDFVDLSKFMAIGSLVLAVGYQDTPDATGGWDAFLTAGADCTDGQANGSGNFAFTNTMQVGVGESLGYTINVTYLGGLTNNIQLQGYNGGTPVGSPVTLNAGINGGTLPGSDRIRITSTGTQDFTYTLTVVANNTYRIVFEAGEITTDERQNNYLSWANIIERFWKYDRYAEAGFINGSGTPTTFDSVKPLKEQDEFKFYHGDDIDPMRGITTDYGVGMIQTMERDLASDFITLKLRYE